MMGLEFGIAEWLLATYLAAVLVVSAAVLALAAIVAGMSLGCVLADWADAFIDKE